MKNLLMLLALSSIWAVVIHAAPRFVDDRSYTTNFGVDKKELSSTGKNPYFILIPGYQLNFEGMDEGAALTLTITVLNDTKTVDGVETRVVEERETSNGQIVEISRNYFAISKRTNDVYYFGEDVDIYKSGKIVSHEGSWLSGIEGAKFGLYMPGTPLLGSRFAQEIAPGNALDRCEIVRLDENVTTPVGKFERALTVEETTPLEPGVTEMKYYGAGVGLLREGKLKLVKYGLITK